MSEFARDESVNIGLILGTKQEAEGKGVVEERWEGSEIRESDEVKPIKNSFFHKTRSIIDPLPDATRDNCDNFPIRFSFPTNRSKAVLPDLHRADLLA